MQVWRVIAVFVVLLLANAFITPAFAQDPWVDDALAFVDVIKDEAYKDRDSDWEDYEQSIATLPSADQLDRYQELAFHYHVSLRYPKYVELKALYSPELRANGNADQLNRQAILDAFEITSRDGQYVETVDEINRLINANILTDEQLVWAYVARAYVETDMADVPNALQAMQNAKVLYARLPPTVFLSYQTESMAAYVLAGAGDYASVITSYRRIAQLPPVFGFNHDTVSTIANIIWMLKQQQYYDIALKVNDALLSVAPDDLTSTEKYLLHFSCGEIQVRLENFEEALSCLSEAGEHVFSVPERWPIWASLQVDALARAGHLSEAKTLYEELVEDSRYQQSELAHVRVRVAEAILAKHAGQTDEAFNQFLAILKAEAAEAVAERRVLANQTRALIENETRNLELNARLQETLLKRQTILTLLSIAVSLILVLFLFYLLVQRRKERRFSITDALTGLCNRRGFGQELRANYEVSLKSNTDIALGILDLDGFKAINDIHGHAIGDEVLILTARRLRQWLGQSAPIGRLGGDEFAFIITDFSSRHDLLSKAEELCASLGQPERFGQTNIVPRFSLGIAICSGGNPNITDLYDRADFTLYSNKENANERVNIFDEVHNKELVRQKVLESALVESDAEDFYMVYHPIVSAERGKTVGFEALARWNSPSIGDVGPNEFIPIAERMARIRPLTKVFLSRALEAAKTWPEDLTLSFNLSSHDLASLQSAIELRSIILESGFPAERIIVEVTETAIIQDIENARAASQILSEIGVGIALDDFGTGYSSLVHAHKFKIDRIKVDATLTDGLESNDDKRNIVKLLIDLSTSMNIDCVLEGIENDKQVGVLREMNADLMQGYLVAKPMRNDEIPEFLTRKLALK